MIAEIPRCRTVWEIRNSGLGGVLLAESPRIAEIISDGQLPYFQGTLSQPQLCAILGSSSASRIELD